MTAQTPSRSTQSRLPAPKLSASQITSGKYLTFRLWKEKFGIHVMHVREIMEPAHLKA